MDTKAKSRVERTPDSLDLYLSEDTPIGEEIRTTKISIPLKYSRVGVGDSLTGHLRVKAADIAYLSGIPAIRTELDVESSTGYEGEADEVYWVYITEFEKFVGIRHSSSHVERKGYSHSYNGPFRPSQEQLDSLRTAGIDLAQYSGHFQELVTMDRQIAFDESEFERIR